MAGYGSRFVKSGYKTYKPFLRISESQNMIMGICNKFPKKTIKHFIINDRIKKKYIDILKNIPNSKIIKIKIHKLGPVETILRATKDLKDLKNIFVSYCDINWKWNFDDVNLKRNCIYCYKGWHPYTKNNNNYAFCKTKKNNELIKIKEKSSFTNKWQNEPLSIGLFYFVDFQILIKSFLLLKKKKIKTNNEYFPSESFNFIKNTKIAYVKQFVHIGSPRYLEEYKNWFFFFKEKKLFINKIKKTKIADNYLIPAAGEGKRFKNENIFVPKFLIYIKSIKRRSIDYINTFLPNKKKVLILKYKNYFTKFIDKKKFLLFFLNKKTKGQAFTIYKYLNQANVNGSFIINSCDVFSLYNIESFLKLKINSDIIIFVSSKSFQDLEDHEYTWIENEKNYLKNIYIKNKPVKNLKILTGNFYFKNKEIFKNCFENSLRNFDKKELYIDDLIKTSLDLNCKVRVMEDDKYINFGTPNLIKDFIFWEKYFKNDR